MERARKILRCSVITFLGNYHHSAMTAATLVAIPFTFAILLSQATLPTSSLVPIVSARLRTLFFAAGFPYTSEFFLHLSLKLSQTITSLVLLLPFTFSFHLLAKTYVIRSTFRHENRFYTSTFISLFFTQIWNSFLILSANSLCFFLVSFTFSCMEGFGFKSHYFILFISASGAILYSILIANAYIISNLALVCSGMEGSGGGYIAILQACVLIKGRSATALALALPINMAMTSVEALFHYRVMRGYRDSNNIMGIMALEGILIAYLYSIVFVLDTVVSCMFYRSCRGLNLAKIESRDICVEEITNDLI